MARSQSLFRTQTRGLLLRTWHWERRKYCNIVCNYFLPPFFIILLKILQNVITSDPDPVFPFQRNPAGAFAPRPFDPARCLQRADDIESSAALRFCEQNPFLLDYPVPVLAPAALSDAIGSRNALDSSDDSGLMEGFSLQPFIFPGALRGQSFFTQQNSYDGVLLHASFDGNSTSSVYQQLLDAEEDNTVDQNYRLHTKPFESKQELFSTLYDSWYKGSIFNKFYSAFSFEQYEETDTSLSISTTVFYNESSSTNCTDSCPLVSNLVHMENAIYQRLNPGKTAIAFLRRMPPILNEEDLGFLQLVISIFIGLTSHFLLPFFLRFLVFERVARLRALMSIMGLKSRQYWFGTYIGLLTQFFLSQAFTLIIAGLAGVAFYVDNTPISYLLLFFLW